MRHVEGLHRTLEDRRAALPSATLFAVHTCLLSVHVISSRTISVQFRHECTLQTGLIRVLEVEAAHEQAV